MARKINYTGDWLLGMICMCVSVCICARYRESVCVCKYVFLGGGAWLEKLITQETGCLV